MFSFESTSDTSGSGDTAVNINRDGEFTYLDPNTYFYKNTWKPLVEADYKLKPAEAKAGFDLGNTVRNGGDHADYQIIFSSDTLYFDMTGTTINVSAVPIPAAVWLFSSALVGLFARRKIAA